MKHFHHPLTLEHLQEVCSPETKSCFAHPWEHDGKTYAANGYMVVRYERSYGLDTNAEAVQRVATLPWGLLASETLKESAWAPMDAVRGGLWKQGELEAFGTSPDGRRFARIARRALVGESYACVSVPILQMASKFPKAELYAGPLSKEWVLFRFNGGTGLIKALNRSATYHIFKPKPGLFA